MLEVWIAADPAVVFSFFTNPDDFASGMGGAMGTATVEPRVGGEVRVAYGMALAEDRRRAQLSAPPVGTVVAAG